MKRLLILVLLLGSTVSIADSKNTTPAPDWYYDVSMGMANAIASITVGAVNNPVGNKIETWTTEEAINPNGIAYVSGQAAGYAQSTIGTGGSYVFGLTNKLTKVSNKLAKTADKLDETTSKLDETTSKLDETADTLAKTEDKLAKTEDTLAKVVAKQADDDARRLAAARIREAEKANQARAKELGLTELKKVDLLISED